MLVVDREDYGTQRARFRGGWKAPVGNDFRPQSPRAPRAAASAGARCRSISGHLVPSPVARRHGPRNDAAAP